MEMMMNIFVSFFIITVTVIAFALLGGTSDQTDDTKSKFSIKQVALFFGIVAIELGLIWGL